MQHGKENTEKATRRGKRVPFPGLPQQWIHCYFYVSTGDRFG